MVENKQSIKNNFRYLWSLRFWLAGPFGLIAAIVIMASMSLWLPGGRANIDHLVIPVLLFPLIWSVVFFYAILESKVGRAALVFAVTMLINGGLVAASIMGWLA